MQKKMRCTCLNLTNNNFCKNKSYNLYWLENKQVCKFHYNYYNNKYALIIQKIYKGYKQRKIIKNIFIKLPEDIQHIILSYVKRDYYYNKYLKTIHNIVENKVIKSINIISSNLNKIDLINPGRMHNLYTKLNDNENTIINSFKLYKKYYITLKNNSYLKKKLIPNMLHDLCNFINHITYGITYSNNSNLCNLLLYYLNYITNIYNLTFNVSEA